MGKKDRADSHEVIGVMTRGKPVRLPPPLAVHSILQRLGLASVGPHPMFAELGPLSKSKSRPCITTKRKRKAVRAARKANR